MTTDTAVLLGAIAATFVSALTVLGAFLRPTLRYLYARLSAQRPSFPDRLCAGIWTSAAGATVICMVGTVRLLTGNLFAGVAVIAWVGICAGYFLHFTAWRASFNNRESGFALGWALVLAAIWVLVTWGALALPAL